MHATWGDPTCLQDGPGRINKQAVTRKPLARSRPELKRSVISHMRSLSKSPQRVRSLFRHPTFRYAA
jgi:hypothetical protein